MVFLSPNSTIAFRERPACELCGGGEYNSLLRRNFLDPAVWGFIERYYAGRVPREVLSDAVYEIVRCRRCGFLWQRFVLNDAGLIMLYEKWIDAAASLKKRSEGDLGLYTNYAKEMMIIGRLFPGKKPYEIRVLDYGMGWGRWTFMAKAFGFEAAGLELSEQRIAYARQDAVTVLTEEEVAGNRFHFINSEQCFEHITDPRETLKRLLQSLLPGGIVRLSVPDAGRSVARLSQSGWNASKDPFHPLEHISGYTHDSLVRLGRQAGLELVHRPVFPVLGLDASSLLRGAVGSIYYRFAGTSLYFRKPFQ